MWSVELRQRRPCQCCLLQIQCVNCIMQTLLQTSVRLQSMHSVMACSLLNGCTSHLLRHCQAVCISNDISVAVPLVTAAQYSILAGLGGEPQSRICSKTASQFSKCFFFRHIVQLNNDLVLICITAPSELDLPLFIAACSMRIANR